MVVFACWPLWAILCRLVEPSDLGSRRVMFFLFVELGFKYIFKLFFLGGVLLFFFLKFLVVAFLLKILSRICLVGWLVWFDWFGLTGLGWLVWVGVGFGLGSVLGWAGVGLGLVTVG